MNFKNLFIVLLLIIVYGCEHKGEKRNKDSITGTDGLVINFLENNPKNNYSVNNGKEEPISIIVKMRNKGAYPQEDQENILDKGQVYISGFDSNIIQIKNKSKRLDKELLTGVSSVNPKGSVDTADFKGLISGENIAYKYEPKIVANICYPYFTKAITSVCIDPNPFDDKQKKACRFGTKTLTSQGAPIAIRRIDQEASTSKNQFKIHIWNVGGGDVIALNSLEKCSPEGEIFKREDFNIVELLSVSAGPVELNCIPPDEGSNIRLVNGKGFVICSLERNAFEDANSAYTTLLNIELRYGYRTSISKKIKISKIESN